VKLNHKAVSSLEAILILAVIALIGGAGYSVYHTNKTISGTYTAASQDSGATEKTSAQQTTGSHELVIKEWNVKMTVPASLKTVTYKYKKPDAITDSISLHSTLQDSLMASCPYARTDPWGVNQQPNGVSHSAGLLIVGEFSYARVYPQAGCEDQLSVMQTLEAGFKAMFQSITKS